MTAEQPKTIVTNDQKSWVRPTTKDMVQVAASIIAVLLGVWGVGWGLYQQGKQVRSEQAKVAREVIEKLVENPEAKAALQMLDWPGREFEIAPGKRDSITRADLKKALSLDDSSFDDKKMFIRNGFDKLFDGFELIEHYIDLGLIRFEDVEIPLSYYVVKLNNRREFVGEYLDVYGYSLTQKLLARFKKEWPTADAQEKK